VANPYPDPCGIDCVNPLFTDVNFSITSIVVGVGVQCHFRIIKLTIATVYSTTFLTTKSDMESSVNRQSAVNM